MYRVQFCLKGNKLWYSVGNLDQSLDANMIAFKLSKFDDCSYRVLNAEEKQIGLYVQGEVIECEDNWFKIGDKI